MRLSLAFTAASLSTLIVVEAKTNSSKLKIEPICSTFCLSGEEPYICRDLSKPSHYNINNKTTKIKLVIGADNLIVPQFYDLNTRESPACHERFWTKLFSWQQPAAMQCTNFCVMQSYFNPAGCRKDLTTFYIPQLCSLGVSNVNGLLMPIASFVLSPESSYIYRQCSVDFCPIPMGKYKDNCAKIESTMYVNDQDEVECMLTALCSSGKKQIISNRVTLPLNTTNNPVRNYMLDAYNGTITDRYRSIDNTAAVIEDPDCKLNNELGLVCESTNFYDYAVYCRYPLFAMLFLFVIANCGGGGEYESRQRTYMHPR